MGKRGRKPTPTAILRARGSWRAGINRTEPMPQAKRPPCPRRLGKAQRSVWNQIARMLVPHGVLTEWDRYALERYCDLLVQYRSAADALAVDGLTHEVIDSQSRIQTKLRPEFEAQGKLAVLLAKLEACFGMTPADRARISIGGEPKEENPKERFFKTA